MAEPATGTFVKIVTPTDFFGLSDFLSSLAALLAASLACFSFFSVSLRAAFCSRFLTGDNDFATTIAATFFAGDCGVLTWAAGFLAGDAGFLAGSIFFGDFVY